MLGYVRSPTPKPAVLKMANTLNAQCSVSRTLDLIGDQWTMLVLRELFWGAHRFEEFRANLGIARNILSDRLRKLTEAQI